MVASPASPYHDPATRFILLTPPPVDAEVRARDLLSRSPARAPDRSVENTHAFAQAVKDLGAARGLPVLDVWTAINDAAGREGFARYLSDGLHLTPEGYEIVSAGLKKTIEVHFPELHWDAMPMVYPHWTEARLQQCIATVYRANASYVSAVDSARGAHMRLEHARRAAQTPAPLLSSPSVSWRARLDIVGVLNRKRLHRRRWHCRASGHVWPQQLPPLSRRERRSAVHRLQCKLAQRFSSEQGTLVSAPCPSSFSCWICCSSAVYVLELACLSLSVPQAVRPVARRPALALELVSMRHLWTASLPVQESLPVSVPRLPGPSSPHSPSCPPVARPRLGSRQPSSTLKASNRCTAPWQVSRRPQTWRLQRSASVARQCAAGSMMSAPS